MFRETLCGPCTKMYTLVSWSHTVRQLVSKQICSGPLDPVTAIHGTMEMWKHSRAATRGVLRENLLQESRSLKSLASRERLHARDREIKAFLSTFFKHFFMREAASTVLVWMLLLLLSGWKHGVGKKVNYLSVLLCPAHCTAHCSTARAKFCAFFVWAHRQAG